MASWMDACSWVHCRRRARICASSWAFLDGLVTMAVNVCLRARGLGRRASSVPPPSTPCSSSLVRLPLTVLDGVFDGRLLLGALSSSSEDLRFDLASDTLSLSDIRYDTFTSDLPKKTTARRPGTKYYVEVFPRDLCSHLFQSCADVPRCRNPICSRVRSQHHFHRHSLQSRSMARSFPPFDLVPPRRGRHQLRKRHLKVGGRPVLSCSHQ